ncbi:VWA domain-containing protein [Marinicauda salina]|nr:VWA domain-containing protein [Marinicauda salina]
MTALRIFFLVMLAASGLQTRAAMAEDVMVVFDGSNSMWGQIEGAAKIEIARNAMDRLLSDWTETRAVGLMAYGHRRRGDCSDIELLVEPAPGNAEAIRSRIAEVTPQGKTPLTDAVEQAAQTLAYRDRPATVVLISDGIESCRRDPCELAAELERTGVSFTAHVVGFGLSEGEAGSLACIAEETGGRYLAAADAGQLGDALGEIAATVSETTPPEPEPEPAYDVSLTAPDAALAGSAFDVSWTGAVSGDDYITIVPADADEGSRDNHFRVRDKTEDSLRAPGAPGLYEVRYVLDEGDRTLASQDIEVTEPEVSLTAPDTALAGSAFDVSWTGAVSGDDYVTIVPADAEEGSRDNHFRVRDKSEDSLRAPGSPGFYEVRYVLDEGDRTLASQDIEVTEPEVSLTAPETALAGSAFDVSWTGAVSGDDYVTIVPADAEEGTRDNHFRVRDKSEDSLRAPGAPGLYEVRYVLDEGDRTLASQGIEVTEPEVSLTAPDTALAGSAFDVSWTGAVSGDDYVTIVPADADEGTRDNHFRVRDKTEDSLRAPGAPGLYEVRYVLDEGDRTLASQGIEVTEPEVSLTAPEDIRSGDEFQVSWTGAVNGADYVTIVPVDADEGSRDNHFRVRDKSEDSLRAPDAPGLYEVRYVLDEGDRTLARATIEVLDADAPIERGGSLSAPETAAPGATIDVGWRAEGEGGDRRVALARQGQSLFTWIVAVEAEDGAPAQINLPDAPGFYELRLIDVDNREIVARRVIEVR